MGTTVTASEPGAAVPEKRRPRRRIILEWVAVVVAAVLLAIGVRAFLFQSFFIPSGSMIPTLEVGDRILVDKISYDLHAVHRGDVVVFARPAADKADPTIKDLVKRVIGLPGDTISSVNGHVDIDGHRLSEPYLPKGTLSEQIPPYWAHHKLPPDEYFVMGDNRQYSYDSRFFGPIPGKLIVGRAVLRIWPFSRLGTL